MYCSTHLGFGLAPGGGGGGCQGICTHGAKAYVHMVPKQFFTLYGSGNEVFESLFFLI